MTRAFKPYLAALLVMGVLDALWLGVLARDFYRQELGEQMVAQVRWVPALLFYVAYPAALVGLVAYGVYDLTNLATLRHWPVRLALVDMAWGTFASTLAGATAAWTTRRFG